MTEKPLDDIFEPEIPKTNYKKWSFRMLIYTLVCNVIVTYLIATSTSISLAGSPDSFGFNIMILSFLATSFFLAGVILTILSHFNKEERNYQYHVSVWGYLIFILLTLLTLF